MRRFIIAALALVLAACADPIGPDRFPLSARLHAGGVTILNRGTSPIYYFAVERETAAVVLWGPCSDPDVCPFIPATGRMTVGPDRVVGWDPSAREVLLYWWRLVPARDGFAPDSVRFLLVSR